MSSSFVLLLENNCISRSNAIALGVLIKHFHMDFFDAWKLIEQKVPICNIDLLHIIVLKRYLM